MSGKWFNGVWPSLASTLSMAVLELFPIVLAFQVWVQLFANHKVLIFCDNHAVTDVINRQSARCSKLMFLMRELTLICLNNNVLLRAQFIPGRSNVLGDSLSRHQMDRFRNAAPCADILPTPTPTASSLFCSLKSSV